MTQVPEETFTTLDALFSFMEDLVIALVQLVALAGNFLY